jgi:hypothetical protein
VAELDAISAWAVADELQKIHDEAVGRGVGYVSVYDIDARVKAWREYARETAAAAEEQYRRIRNADVARNFGIGQGE